MIVTGTDGRAVAGGRRGADAAGTCTDDILGGPACTFRIRVDAHAVERMTEPEDVTDDRISARSSE